MKNWPFLLLLSVQGWAACPLYTYPENHKLDQELNNVCDNIANPSVGYITASSGTATYLTVSSMSVSGQIQFNPTTHGLLGTVSSDDAIAGVVGERFGTFVSATNFPASGNWGDLTSQTLTAGDYDFDFYGVVVLNGSTTADESVGYSETTGNVIPPGPEGQQYFNLPAVTAGLNRIPVAFSNRYRFGAGGGTLYMKYKATYTVGTPQMTGHLNIRRVR